MNAPTAHPTRPLSQTWLRILLHLLIVVMALRVAIHPMYDKLLLNAVRDWKYRPATVNGTPVRFRKVVQISLPRK